MTYQIDQSGKIEQTNIDTVIAFTNSETGSVTLPAKEKRRLQELFRTTGMPRLFIDVTFAIMVFLLIKKHIEKHTFTIDREYPNHEKTIEKMINKLSNNQENIIWRLLGKSSKAHDIAYKTFIGKVEIKRRIKAKEIWKLAKKIAGGRLNTGLSPASRRSIPANK